MAGDGGLFPGLSSSINDRMPTAVPDPQEYLDAAEGRAPKVVFKYHAAWFDLSESRDRTAYEKTMTRAANGDNVVVTSRSELLMGDNYCKVLLEWTTQRVVKPPRKE